MSARTRQTKTIAIASQKGGCGKTTLAVHLAVYATGQRRRVLIVDTDPQQSASKWYDRREEESPPLVTAPLGELREIVEQAQSEGFGYVVVDTPPHVGTQIDQAVGVADLILVPCNPTPMDVDAIPATVEIIDVHQRPAGFVLTSMPLRSSITEETRTLLGQEYPHIPVCPADVGHRTGYYYALIDGRAVNEFEPRGKAAAELVRLVSTYARDHGLGIVTSSETGFRIESDPDTVRAPDMAFVRRNRIPAGNLPKSYFPGAPDLAAEVVPHNDSYGEVQEKVRAWLAAGAQTVWVLDPRSRTVAIHSETRTTDILALEDDLAAPDLLPGWSCAVRDLFPS